MSACLLARYFSVSLLIRVSTASGSERDGGDGALVAVTLAVLILPSRRPGPARLRC